VQGLHYFQVAFRGYVLGFVDVEVVGVGMLGEYKANDVGLEESFLFEGPDSDFFVPEELLGIV